MKKDLPKAYIAKDYEDAIYKKWEESGSFQPSKKSKKKPFTVTMPPPNATGTLHLGHAVMLALEDIMIRYQRMQGRPTLWIPGTDHAGIATQNKVEKDVLKAEGKTRHDFPRDVFLQKIQDFVAGSQNTIRSQVRKMGSSCDWTREAYTMDKTLNETVFFVFEKMFQDGLIYRGDRIVNWCTRCQSTLADDEVNYKEVTGKFYHFKYGPFEIGTSRPETKYGDHVVVVHPDDERYKKYHGKKIQIDWIGEEPITATVVADTAAKMEVGTGVMTATPAHDFIDFDLAQRHGFEPLQMINEEGRMTAANGPFEGITVEEAREKFVEILQKKGLMTKIDDTYVHNLSVCYRCGTTIQPLISKQWFIDVNHPISTWDYKNLKLEKGRAYSLKEVALHVVRSEMIQIIPDRFNATYFQWLENLRDWCISRQIWWGHRIPVWYPKGADVKTVNVDRLKVSTTSPGKDWQQDEDTFDTWFSAGMFTFSSLGWLQKNPDFKKFHPTQVLETGYDILFFWVARMILLTTYATGQIPFETVYLHGLVRTRDGKKMSKSNPETCIDPLDMIRDFGADALRLSLFVGSSAGNDMRLYKEKIEGYRNFVNKLWNVARYILMSVDDPLTPLQGGTGLPLSRGLGGPPKPKTLADQWILSRLARIIENTTKLLSDFKFSQAAEELYAFTWSDLADWYLEISKVHKGPPNPLTRGNNTDQILLFILKNLLKLWHPFTPFVTEELWKHTGEQEMLINAPWPKEQKKLVNAKAEQDFEVLRSAIVAIRNLRTEHKVEPAKKIHAIITAEKKGQKLFNDNEEIVKFLGRVENLEIQDAKARPKDSVSKYFDTLGIHLPLKGLIDLDKKKERLEKEREKLEGYVKSLEAKLKNKKFLEHAPSDIVEAERLKQQKARESLKKVQEQLSNAHE